MQCIVAIIDDHVMMCDSRGVFAQRPDLTKSKILFNLFVV